MVRSDVQTYDCLVLAGEDDSYTTWAVTSQPLLLEADTPMDVMAGWLDDIEIKIACVAELLLVEDEEETPYKSKYAAIDLLQEVIDQGQALASSNGSCSNGFASASDHELADTTTATTLQSHSKASGATPVNQQPTKVQLEVAKLRARRGIIMMDTDLRGDGEQCLLQALPVLEAAPAQITELQECWNTLGALHSSRGSFDVAIIWLHKAEALYDAERKNVQQQQLEQCVDTQVSDVMANISALSSQQPDVVKLEAQYTSTVFFLAQASIQ